MHVLDVAQSHASPQFFALVRHEHFKVGSVQLLGQQGERLFIEDPIVHVNVRKLESPASRRVGRT